MIDSAFHELAKRINSTDQPSLWLVDENISDDDISVVIVRPSLSVITNRYDVFIALKKRGFITTLSDFDFSDLEKNSFSAIYYRVSKEKAIVHHIINRSADYLQNAGLLVMAGYKNEGTKTYIDKAQAYLGGGVSKGRGKNSALIALIENSANRGTTLDDKNYSDVIEITSKGCRFFSKPGIYGWNKIDKGSEFLIDNFDTFLRQSELINSNHSPITVIDLGCGYGYLSVCANQLLKAHYIASDSNVSAVALCEKNLLENGVDGMAVLDDCAAGIDVSADLVLCNPPFHQGFDVNVDLTSKFLSATHRLLSKGGVALFVVNSFIGVEKKAKALFSTVEPIKNDGSFKLVMLRK